MNIFDHIQQSIATGLDAKLETEDGTPGVLFLDENEFVPLSDLNYNAEIGYFRVSLFPDARRECERFDRRRLNKAGGKRGRTWAVNSERVTGYIPKEWANELVRFGSHQADAVRTAIDLALHPMGEDSLLIRLADPLPCAIRRDGGLCGQPAHVAYAYEFRSPVTPGMWVLQPVCRDCARKAAELYDV